MYATDPCSDAAWNVPTLGISLPSNAALVGPGANGSCRWSTSGANTRNASSVRSDAVVWSWTNGTTLPLDATPVVGPTVVTPGSGGGPSVGPMTRASTPMARSARARPSTWPWTPPGTDREYGDSNATRISPPTLRSPGCGDVGAGAAGGSSRSLGQFGCITCHCSGAMRTSSSKRRARSWVTRRTSSRRRPRRSTVSGAQIRTKCRPCGRKYTAVGMSVAPVRSASVAGPAGRVVVSPKNSTSMPSPAMSRSESRHTTRFSRSTRITPAAADGPSGITSMPMARRTSANHSKSSGGSTDSTTTAGGSPRPASHAAAKSKPPRCGNARITPLPASRPWVMCSKPTDVTRASTDPRASVGSRNSSSQ